MAQVHIVTHATEVARDAILGWDAGDMVYVAGVGLTTYNGSTWDTIGLAADPPEVPATPSEQDIVDALVTLGLVTQAEA